jgi:hypothetical protein
MGAGRSGSRSPRPAFPRKLSAAGPQNAFASAAPARMVVVHDHSFSATAAPRRPGGVFSAEPFQGAHDGRGGLAALAADGDAARRRQRRAIRNTRDRRCIGLATLFIFARPICTSERRSNQAHAKTANEGKCSCLPVAAC